MKVLIACEFSGIVRDAFIDEGHDAISCDLLPTEKPGPHYVGNVFDIINNGFDLMIAHPPCTYLANSGVCHLHTDAKRWFELFNAASFFKQLQNANIPRIAIENPIMHKYARQLLDGSRPDQIVQPWMFGHAEQKATCFWLKSLEKLTPTNIVKKDLLLLQKKDRQRLHFLPPSADRWRLRSKTFTGIACAMAKQWGNQ